MTREHFVPRCLLDACTCSCTCVSDECTPLLAMLPTTAQGRDLITSQTKSIISHLGRWETAPGSYVQCVTINTPLDSESKVILCCILLNQNPSHVGRLLHLFPLVHCSLNSLQEKERGA